MAIIKDTGMEQLSNGHILINTSEICQNFAAMF